MSLRYVPQQGNELEKSPSLKLGLFLLYTVEGLQKSTRYFCKFIQAANQVWPSPLTPPQFCCCFATCELKEIFLVVRPKKKRDPGPGIWGLMLPSAECHLFPLAPELPGWGPGTAEPDGAGQLSRRCNSASWERSQFTPQSVWPADRPHLTCHPAAKCFPQLPENSTPNWERRSGCV